MNIRENRGITLVALVITIVLILIVVGISITNFLGSNKISNKNNKISELNMMQHAILERYTKAQLTKETLPGISIDIKEVQLIINEMNSISNENIQLKGTEYKKLSTEDLDNLGISNVSDTFIVNYKTGEVINSSLKVTEDGEALYTYAKDNED